MTAWQSMDRSQRGARWRGGFRGWPPCSLFRTVWLREGWTLGGMDRAAWERLAEVVFAEVTAVDLPGRVHARRREAVVQLGRRS